MWDGTLKMVHVSLVLLATWSLTVNIKRILWYLLYCRSWCLPNQISSGFRGVASVLPPGWSDYPTFACIAWVLDLFHPACPNIGFRDCVFTDSFPGEMLFGPNFTDPVHLTIESCVSFCDQQGSRMAGLKGTECRKPYFLWSPWALQTLFRLLKHIQSNFMLREWCERMLAVWKYDRMSWESHRVLWNCRLFTTHVSHVL